MSLPKGGRLNTPVHLSHWHFRRTSTLHAVHVCGVYGVNIAHDVNNVQNLWHQGDEGVSEGVGWVIGVTRRQRDNRRVCVCVCVCCKFAFLWPQLRAELCAALHAACHSHSTACIHYCRYTGPFTLWHTHTWTFMVLLLYVLFVCSHAEKAMQYNIINVL